MIATQLDAVNLILRKLGEPPIISLDVQYPTLDLVGPALDDSRLDLLVEGWWFNTFSPTVLMPDPEGRVPVPPDTLVFSPDDPEKFLWAGAYIVLPDGSQIVGESVPGSRVVDMPFEAMPTSARSAVAHFAALNVYGSDVGIDDIYGGIQELYQIAYRELSRTHTRQRKFSMRRKLQYRRWQHMLRS